MERISALMDGELESEETASVIPAVRQRADLREAWATYHLIGDALRGQACARCDVSSGVAVHLAKEPTVLAPPASSTSFGKRWALPSLAAAAAVATVTWMSLQTQEEMVTQMARSEANVHSVGWRLVPTAGTTADGSAIDELMQVGGFAPQPGPPIQVSGREAQAYLPYLMAHQEFSPSTAIQGLAPYVRTVTSTASER